MKTGIIIAVVAGVAIVLFLLLTGAFENFFEDRKYRNRSGWHKNPLDGMWHHDMPDL